MFVVLLYDSNEICHILSQFVNAKEFASSEEMKEFRNKTHLLKAKFKRSTLRSGECE
jgi:hypothetical protein